MGPLTKLLQHLHDFKNVWFPLVCPICANTKVNLSWVFVVLESSFGEEDCVWRKLLNACKFGCLLLLRACLSNVELLRGYLHFDYPVNSLRVLLFCFCHGVCFSITDHE